MDNNNKSNPPLTRQRQQAADDDALERDQQRQELSILSFIYNGLFLLGTLLVVFAAFRNTLTWYVRE